MTFANQIPEAVQALLREHVTSFEALAVLLLLRADPNARPTIEAIASQIPMPLDLTVGVIHSLRESALVACKPDAQQMFCHYAPGNPQLARATDALAHTFEEQRVAVISFMNANAIERVRSGALRTFSDAFIIRKKEDNDG